MSDPASPRLDDEQQGAWRDYLRAHSLLLATLDRRLRERTGCTIADYEVLVNVSEAPGRRIRQVDLGEAMHWEKSRLSHQLTRMEQRGFVRRRPSKVDARGTDVELTARGLRAIRAEAPGHAADVVELFVEPLEPGMLAALGEASRRIRAAIVDADATARE